MIQARTLGNAVRALSGVLLLAGACWEEPPFYDAGICTITLSGAITATSGCTATAVHYDLGNDTVISIVGLPADAGYSLFSFGSDLGTEDISAVIHYDVDNVRNAETVASAGQTSSWEQSLRVGSSHPDQGTFSLFIESAGLKITNGSDAGATWVYVSGSLDATLPPLIGTGATGTVTARVTF
jgi:hypothetical protein